MKERRFALAVEYKIERKFRKIVKIGKETQRTSQSAFSRMLKAIRIQDSFLGR